MALKLLYMLLFLVVALARTIDIHISDDRALMPLTFDETTCEMRIGSSCNAECGKGEEECYAGRCGKWGCCSEGYNEKLCCKKECPKGDGLIKEEQQVILVPGSTADDNGCHWEGTAPSCVTGCGRGKLCGVDACGGGACCWTGWKSWCCDKCP